MKIQKIFSSLFFLLEKISKFLTAVVYAVIIFFSLIPSGIPSYNNSDKVGHYLAYAALGFICSFTFRNKIFLFMIVNFCMSCSIEVIQHFIPGRSMSVFDELANVTGLLTGYLIYRLTIKFERRITI